MRVYHFLNEKYGLQAIADAKLKIGRLASFNDPFEYFHLDTDNYVTRKVIQGRRKRASWDYGVICFSQNYTNPVQWAHYSDSHKGLCLGFDIPDEMLLKIDYIDERAPQSEFKVSLEHKKEQFVKYMLSKKYKHWAYEEEHRLLIKFSERRMDNELIFKDFCDEIQLKEVLIGFRSQISKKRLKGILKRYSHNASVDIVLPSNKRYEMVASIKNT